MAAARKARIASTLCLVDSPRDPVARLLLAHGAGAPMDSPFMDEMVQLICARGVETLRFEFPYMARRRETGRKAPPDRQPVLLQTFEALVRALDSEKGAPLFIGGKSMGGRMASLLAEELPFFGTLCLGYPFHPVGKPDRLRTEHLKSYRKPLLIVQGTRDTMGSREEVAGYGLSKAVDLHWLEGANHDLKPLRSTGCSHADYLQQAADVVHRFMRNASGVP